MLAGDKSVGVPNAPGPGRGPRSSGGPGARAARRGAHFPGLADRLHLPQAPSPTPPQPPREPRSVGDMRISTL